MDTRLLGLLTLMMAHCLHLQRLKLDLIRKPLVGRTARI